MSLIPLAIFDVGGQELIVIFLAILLFLGPKKLPELARALAKAKSEFNKASRHFNDELERAAQLPDNEQTKQLPDQTDPHQSDPSGEDRSQKKSPS